MCRRSLGVVTFRGRLEAAEKTIHRSERRNRSLRGSKRVRKPLPANVWPDHISARRRVWAKPAPSFQFGGDSLETDLLEQHTGRSRLGLHLAWMISPPEPRGLLDYAFFALVLTVALVGLFWLEASDGVGWADAGFALAAAALPVLGIILARQNEKAAWIVRPTWRVRLLFTLGAFALLFVTISGDAYILHRRDLTAGRFSRDVAVGIALGVTSAWSLRRRNAAGRQLP